MSLIHGPLVPRAIETIYAETIFRSRLEARWACFFDLVGWPWLYEPIDLDGYIPDFILQFHRPLLLEVKPAILFTDLESHTTKIDASGWPHEAVVVGAALWPRDDGYGHRDYLLGCLGEDVRHLEGRHPHEPLVWDAGVLFRCGICGCISVYHDVQSYRCRAHGCKDGDHHLGDTASELLAELWAEAGNTVRWLRHAARIPRRPIDPRVRMGWARR